VKRLVAAALVALGVACQSASDRPSDPVWGKQACASCAMLIGDPHFAAEWITPAGDHLYFDDVGCMASFLARRTVDAGQAWVRDASGGWQDARGSRFSRGAKTPMDYGFELSSTGALSWSELETAVQRRLAESNQP
jgi:copper chaperone NosL